MAWTIGGIVLPVAPTSIIMGYSADFKEIMVPTTKSILISLGRKVDKMKITGTFVNSALTQAQLETTYLIPFRNLVYTEVTIADGTARTTYDGNWIFTNFTFEEVGGYVLSFKYTMEFIMGSSHEVIA